MELQLTENTWLISDTHFLHDNIVKYCNRPVEHDKIMLENWLSMIKPSDRVLHLGDLHLGKKPMAEPILSQLTGQKWLILGNHDRGGKNWYTSFGFTIIKPFKWWDSKGRCILFTHVPETKDSDWTINIHGHTHNHTNYATISGKDYRNISVEMINYAPVKLGWILE